MSPVLWKEGVLANQANQVSAEALLQPVWCECGCRLQFLCGTRGAVGGRCCPALQTRGAEMFNLCGWDSGSVHSSWQMLPQALKCT